VGAFLMARAVNRTKAVSTALKLIKQFPSHEVIKGDPAQTIELRLDTVDLGSVNLSITPEGRFEARCPTIEYEVGKEVLEALIKPLEACGVELERVRILPLAPVR
jgi:hypothetical protein